MIKWILNRLNEEELEKLQEKYTKEAKSILEEAKKYSNDVHDSVYIYYDRVNIGSEEFLYGMQPIYKNRYLISWLNEQKMQWQQLVKKAVDEGNKEQMNLFAIKMSLIDDLFTDLREFEYRYNEMLNQKKEEQSGGKN